ncbi:PaaI family thioesterase [bacterium]|nr:PaaI family thioesterase [bacterium]
MAEQSLQEHYAPHSTCFGCGPSNAQGLKIRTFPKSSKTEASSTPYRAETAADWTPAAHHEAFPGMLNGGIIGALLDCHSNWTAAYQLMQEQGEEHPPCTVTADFHVKLLRPTPSKDPVHLEARAVDSDGSRVLVEATLSSGGKVCATCKGTFVAVKPGHPAYHRW